MHEAEVLCDRLVIMNKGEVVGEGSPKKLIQQHTPGYVGIFDHKDKTSLQNILQTEKDLIYYEDNSGLYLRGSTLSDLTLVHSKYNLTPLQIRPSNLEDVFLKLTGQEISLDA